MEASPSESLFGPLSGEEDSPESTGVGASPSDGEEVSSSSGTGGPLSGGTANVLRADRTKTVPIKSATNRCIINFSICEFVFFCNPS